ncbi:DUF4259 domain-containing protein [Actinoplanes regularis]|uniref:DUF4259 domain-containing protein n=1 Tax=Actinoplanes regularis TaxID=52697 RepID=UPI0024A4FB69|nr:hypothetical protein Areg01_85780 [Actinoplanes regularis]
MGTCDVGPFDNDDAADLTGELDDAPAHARIEMIIAVLERVADPADNGSRLSDAPRAVAAAALIAAQCPGGASVDPATARARPCRRSRPIFGISPSTRWTA